MFAVFVAQPKRVLVYSSLREAEQGLVSVAMQWASSEVGAKNVHSALESGRALSELPDGLCLRYEAESKDRCIAAIEKKSSTSWFGTVYQEFQHKNQFFVLPVEQVETPVERVKPVQIETHQLATTVGELLMKEIRAALEQRRRAIDGDC